MVSNMRSLNCVVNVIKINEEMNKYSKVFQQLLLTAGHFYHHGDPWSVCLLKGKIKAFHIHRLELGETSQTVNTSPHSLSPLY